MGNTEQQTLVSSTDYRVHETYHSALQHDTADIPPDTWRVSVVNHEMYGIAAVTDTRFPSLGPPTDLFNEFKGRCDQLEQEGLSTTDAHNTAWDDVNFEKKYRGYLQEHWEKGDTSPTHQACASILDELSHRPVVVVCYEADEKQCHRRVLQSFLNNKHSQQ